MSQLRCFVAIPLTDTATRAIVKCGSRIRDIDPRWRDEKWVARENLHVTIAFIGDIDSARVPLIADSLRQAARSVSPSALRFGQLAAHPSPDQARVVWMTVRECGALLGLRHEVVGRLRLEGITASDTGFRPHTTIVRSRRSRPIEAEAVADDVCDEVSAVIMSDPVLTLYSSRLTPRGPHYSVLSAFHFGGE